MATTGISPLLAESPKGYHLPVCPRSWHYLAPISRLEAGPVGLSLTDGSFVGLIAGALLGLVMGRLVSRKRPPAS